MKVERKKCNVDVGEENHQHLVITDIYPQVFLLLVIGR